MEGRFAPKGKVDNRVAGKVDDSIQEVLEPLGVHKIVPFQYGRAPLFPHQGIGAEGTGLGTGSGYLNSVKRREGPQKFPLVWRIPSNSRAFVNSADRRKRIRARFRFESAARVSL